MKIKPKKSFAAFFDQSRKSAAFWEEGAILSFTGGVLQRLKEKGVTQKELADRLKVSPPYVTKLLGGSNNFTLRTMVKIARQLGCEINITLRPAPASSTNLSRGDADAEG